MEPFRLVLALHAPLVLPEVVPRLDTLLHEATCRLHQDWSRDYELPLVFDEARGLYRCSQLIMATTPTTSIWPVNYSRPTNGEGLERASVSNPRKIRPNGGEFLERLTTYSAYWPPYVIFEAQGDAERCVGLLDLLDGIGREHGGGMGRFEVEALLPGDENGWQRRSLPDSSQPYWADSMPTLSSFERLTVTGDPVAVIRPPRILREVLTRGVSRG